MPSLNDTLGARLFQVPDLTTLSKIGPLIRQDRDLVYVADQGAIYEFVQASTDAASAWVVVPYDGNGRFVRTEPRTETALDDAAAAAADAATAQAAAEAAQATADAVAPTIVKGRNLVGGYNVADFNAISYKRFLGMTLVTLDAGTLDPAATGAAVAGDVWTWRGDYWWKIANANGDGFVPAGTVLVMADDSSTIPVGEASGKIATFDGTSNAPTLTAPANYSAVRVVNPDSPFAGQTARWNNLFDSRWSVEAGPNVEALYLNQRHGYFRALGVDAVSGTGGPFVGGSWDAIPYGAQPPQGTVVECEWVIVTKALEAGVGSARFLLMEGAAFYELLDTGYLSPTALPMTTTLKARWVLHTPGGSSGAGAAVIMQVSAVTTDNNNVNVNTTPVYTKYVENYDFGEAGAWFQAYPVFGTDSVDNSASLVAVTGTITRLPAANG